MLQIFSKALFTAVQCKFCSGQIAISIESVLRMSELIALSYNEIRLEDGVDARSTLSRWAPVKLDKDKR